MANIFNEPPTTTYDTLLCLSLTKWVHLNFGDQGIKDLFSKASSLLKPNGLLILEYEPFKAYKKKGSVCARFRENLSLIRLRPKEFPEYLVSRHPFSLVAHHQEASTPYGRSLLVLKKDK